MKANPYSLRALRASATVTNPRPAMNREARLALRAKNAGGGYVDPTLRHETAERVIRAVIKRIEWPRHGAPVTLSATDKADAMGAGMLACVRANFFHHGIMSLAIVKAIRNAIQGPECLRLRRKWEIAAENPAEVAAQVGFATEFEPIGERLDPSGRWVATRRLSSAQKSMAKEIIRTLRAAHEADQSRQKAGNFKSQRAFFLTVLGELTGRGARAMSPQAFIDRRRRFLQYLADGAEALRAKRTPPRLDLEILRALEIRALA